MGSKKKLPPQAQSHPYPGVACTKEEYLFGRNSGSNEVDFVLFLQEKVYFPEFVKVFEYQEPLLFVASTRPRNTHEKTALSFPGQGSFFKTSAGLLMGPYTSMITGKIMGLRWVFLKR